MVGCPRSVRGVHDVRHPVQLLPPVPVHRRGAGPAAVGGDGVGRDRVSVAAEGQGCSECAGLAAPPPKTSTVLLRGLRRETSSIYRS